MRVSSLDRWTARLDEANPDVRTGALWYLAYLYPWRSARPTARQRRQLVARVTRVLAEDQDATVRGAAVAFLGGTTWGTAPASRSGRRSRSPDAGDAPCGSGAAGSS